MKTTSDGSSTVEVKSEKKTGNICNTTTEFNSMEYTNKDKNQNPKWRISLRTVLRFEQQHNMMSKHE